MKLSEEFERLIRTGVQLGRENDLSLTSEEYKQESIIQSFLKEVLQLQQTLGELDSVFYVQEVVKRRYRD